MNTLSRFLREKRAVKKLLRPKQYRRWLKGAIHNLPSLLLSRSLSPMDQYLGESLEFRAPNGEWIQTTGASFGVVREIFGHCCYSPAEVLKNANHILDLGGNAGVFTLFSLACAPRARLHTVEAQPHYIPVIKANVALNGFGGRVTIENAIVGGACSSWTRSLRHEYPEIGDFSPEDYIRRVQVCDFLKCDVEGAEYTLFSGDLSWLAGVRRIALEYHGAWNEGSNLGRRLNQVGYKTQQASHGKLGYIFATRT